MTQVMKASVVRQQWSQLLNQVFTDQTRIVVEKSGIPVAAVISAKELERLTRIDEQRQARFKVLDEIRGAFENIPVKELEKEVNKALAQVRAENRAKRALNKK
ncbi:MAG: Uncharacterized protein G01um10147_549 [Microgenomates group bacterium Gr01-1014_7]|nr:MAG: Uncharacterized protein G01um10147_549 [Microgenomates group bacterium Gr01-1014_7]